MAEHIWVHYALARTAWYELDQDRRERLAARWQQTRAASQAAGARTDGVFTVRGQSDYSTVEVWIFPTVEAAYTHWEALTSAGYAEWFETSNHIGTEVPTP